MSSGSDRLSRPKKLTNNKANRYYRVTSIITCTHLYKKNSIKIFDVVSIFENISDKIKKTNDGFVIRYTNRTYIKGPPVGLKQHF